MIKGRLIELVTSIGFRSKLERGSRLLLVVVITLFAVATACGGPETTQQEGLVEPSTSGGPEAGNDGSTTSLANDPAAIETAAQAEAWAARLAAEHGAPYPGESSAAWVSADIASGWMDDYTLRVLRGEPDARPTGEVLAIVFTATDSRAVFSFERGGEEISYDQDSLLYLFDPASVTEWVGGVWSDEVEAGLAGGRELE